MKEGSTGVGNLGDTEQFKDVTMPDGDACRPDGTLKDASEIQWLNSPSEETRDLPQLSEDGYNSKRSLPCDDEESNSESDGPPRTKAITFLLYSQISKAYRSYGVQRKLNRVLDSDDEVESVGRQSKGQRKVGVPITPHIIKCLPLFN